MPDRLPRACDRRRAPRAPALSRGRGRDERRPSARCIAGRALRRPRQGPGPRSAGRRGTPERGGRAGLLTSRGRDCDADEGSPARGPPRVELVEVPAPSRLAEDDILLRIQAVGICGTDLHYYRGETTGNADFPLPFIMGHEFAGVVESTGAAVDPGAGRLHHAGDSCPMMNGSGKSAFPWPPV